MNSRTPRVYAGGWISTQNCVTGRGKCTGASSHVPGTWDSNWRSVDDAPVMRLPLVRFTSLAGWPGDYSPGRRVWQTLLSQFGGLGHGFSKRLDGVLLGGEQLDEQQCHH